MLHLWSKSESPVSWSQRNDRWNVIIAVAVSLVLTYYYLWQLTAGTWGPLKFTTNYYDMLCEGFRKGHLYIPIAPRPDLLAKPNPWDVKNMPLWIWDASLFNRHYYIYWGPVPALCLWLYKVLTGRSGEIIDQWPGFYFAVGRLYAGAALIVSFANYARTRQRPWVVALAILAFGLASPTPFTIARMHVYEASLMAGQCFLLGGMLGCFWGLVQEKRRMLLFLVASACFGLAVGSHVSTIVASPLIILFTAFFIWYRNERNFWLTFRSLLALGTPALALVLSHFWYNYARFHSPFDFGITHQVTGQPFVNESKYIFPNIFSYLFADVQWSCRFPFVIAPTYRPLSTLIKWPPGYATFERAAGMFPTAAITWLLVIWLWRPLVHAWRTVMSRFSYLAPRISSIEVWLLLCAVANALDMFPTLGQWEASMRYLGDAISGLLLVSFLAGFWLLRMADTRGTLKLRIWAHAGFAVLILHTAFVGAFSGMATYSDQWQQSNPKMWKEMQENLSLCTDAPKGWP